jgi:hypothetical protein
MREPAPPYRGEGPPALWHVSEEARIRRFEPRAGGISPDEPVVWAIDTRHLPLYWFPRECPRGTFWPAAKTTPDDRARFFAGGALRVHAIESAWLERVRRAEVVAYRLPDEGFRPHPEVGGYWTSLETVEPLEAIKLGDLLGLHSAAEIELRIVPDLLELWDSVIASTLEFSGIRLRNAVRRA